MRGAAIILLTVLAGTTGCRTGSGRALDGRLSGSLGRLRQGAAHLFGGELQRSGRFLQRSAAFRPSPHTRLASLTHDAGRALVGPLDRIQELPANLLATATRAGHDAGARLSGIGSQDMLNRQLHPGRWFADWRDGTGMVLDQLDTARYILPGPGDPDRTADPSVLRRQETWIERLLRRL